MTAVVTSALLLLAPVTAASNGSTRSPDTDNYTEQSTDKPAAERVKPSESSQQADAKKITQPVNPFGRAIDLIVNVEYFSKDLGEVNLHMDADGAVTFNASEIQAVLSSLLSESAKVQLATAIGQRKLLTPDSLASMGIDLAFDSENISLRITKIDVSLLRPVPLFGVANNQYDKEITAFPEPAAFFLNASISQSRFWSGPGSGLRNPSVFLTTAASFGHLVLEAAGQFADRNPGAANPDYSFDRNYVRLVYDIPEHFIRTYAGDLSPEVRFQQNFVQMGGVGISRQKQRFDFFRTSVLQGNRQLLLQRESSVDIYRNGILYEQLRLAPGSYDLSNLPLLSGSNDIELRIDDDSGFAQQISYQTYLDPIDLEPGDYEYAAYIAKTADQFGRSPVYNGEMAFTGFFRKAFLNHPAIGVGLQASKSIQQISGQTQFLIGAGRLDMTAAASNSKLGKGYFGGLAYDLSLDQSEKAVTLHAQATVQSKFFTGLGAPFQRNSSIANLSLSASRTFGPELTAQVGANYIVNRSPNRDTYRLFADLYHRLSKQWFIRGGVDYRSRFSATTSSRRSGPGFSVSLIWRPSVRDRAQARYEYHSDTAQLNYTHTPEGYVGSVGYGGLLDRTRGNYRFQGYGSYIGNRFFGSLSHSLFGNGFDQITDRQVTTLRMSSALVYAGGAVALTRGVGDSFAILTPHPTLKGKRVIVGQLLTDNRYRSRSGGLGGAVDGSLSSYVTQSIQYDVEDPPAGYDIGPGVYRVNPSYHSGYHIVVGTDAYVTAMGTLNDTTGKPVGLISGKVIDLSDESAQPIPFFTNSAGRFAIPNLRPLDKYRVILGSGEYIEFSVPQDSKSLIDLSVVTIEVQP